MLVGARRRPNFSQAPIVSVRSPRHKDLKNGDGLITHR